MIIWVRNIIFIVLLLSLIYAVLSASGRMRQRLRLKSQYKAANENQIDSDGTDKEEFMAKGMIKYDRAMRPKLFQFVFIIPIVVISVLIYLSQYT